MKIEEAIDELQEDIALYESDITSAGDGTPDGDLIQALYMAIAALEKQIPKQPIKDKWHHTCCPSCKWLVSYETGWGERYLPHCENCGQAIDWSDEGRQI